MDSNPVAAEICYLLSFREFLLTYQQNNHGEGPPFNYSHLPNKRDVTLTDFEIKFYPPLLVYCSYVLVFSKKKKPSTFIPTSMFTDFTTFVPPPRLFQPPRLLER